MEGRVQIKNVYTKRIVFDGPISTLAKGYAHLPEPVRSWLRELRSTHGSLDDERFARYLSRVLPASVELLACGYLVNVEEAAHLSQHN